MGSLLRKQAYSRALGLLTGLSLLLNACQSIESTTDVTPPPAITHDMPLAAAVDAAVVHGGKTFLEVKRLITRRQEWPKTMKLLESKYLIGSSRLPDDQLTHAAYMYRAAPYAATPAVYTNLVGSARPLARDLGWQIAAAMPSKAIAQAMERELTRAVGDNDEESLFVPAMAEAVRANKMHSAYTLLREGLMETGHEAFAEAMAELAPARASEDFMDYLAKASVEELRQMTLKSVNVYSCLVALRHMLTKPVTLAHGNADYLFLYAVSRNSGLSDLANAVIENNYAVNQRAQFALMLSRMPVWVQVAYIENARRRNLPVLTVFLGELRRVATQTEVIEEIDAGGSRTGGQY